MTTLPPRAIALLAAAVLVARAAPAAANGVFPAADQLVLDPTDPAHIIVRTTYGLLVTADGGAAWDWICEPAVGYQGGNGWHPPIAAAAGGAVLGALTDGLVTSAEGGCAWTRAAPLEGHFVLDVSVERLDPLAAVAVADGDHNTLWQSPDSGASWAQAGVELPKGFRSLTVDVAPADPQRVYLSGLLGPPGSEAGWLAVTPDRGQTWALLPIPGTDINHAPYIAAIDPNDPDRVYVRLDGVPGRLLVSPDAGASWTPAFDAAGFVRAFAISPDGATVVLGGDVDGVQRAPAATLAFEKVSTVAPRCLTWAAAGLYACATEIVDGFTIGLSSDAGATFAPLLHQRCIRGPLDCASGTPVADQCPALWPDIALLTGHADCQPDAGAPDAGGAGGAPPSGGPGAGGSPAPAQPPPSAGGCGCRMAADGSPALLLLIAALAALSRRENERINAKTQGRKDAKKNER